MIYIGGTSSLTILHCELKRCFLTKKAELKREKRGRGSLSQMHIYTCSYGYIHSQETKDEYLR